MKHRIIPTILFDGTTVVKGKKFRNDRTIGSIEAVANLYARRRPDEILFLDICSTNNKRAPNFAIFEYFASKFDIPFGVGGGIKSLADAKRCISSGAEKVVLGTAAADDTHLISEIADQLGSQAVVVSIDFRGENSVYANSGRYLTEKRILDYAREIERCGAGEILLQDIESDGSLAGLNLRTLCEVLSVTNIPIIISGGAGSKDDFFEAFKLGASGVAAGAIFQFTHITPNDVAEYLRKRSVDVRVKINQELFS